MLTFPRLSQGEETDSEKLTHIVSLLDEFCGRLGDEDESRAAYENMLQYFNSLKTTEEDILHKLNNEVLYTRSLEDRLKHKNVEFDNLQLKKALVEEQGRITVAVEDFQKKINETLTSVTNSFSSMDKTLTDGFESLDKTVGDKCDAIFKKAEEIRQIKDEIDDIIVDYNKDLKKSAEDQYELFKNDCVNMLDNCNKRVGEIKESVLSFLKSCSEQNMELVKKIPEQKKKFSVQDIVMYVLCGVCIAGMIVEMV